MATQNFENVVTFARDYANQRGKVFDETAFRQQGMDDFNRHRNFRRGSTSIYNDPGRFQQELFRADPYMSDPTPPPAPAPTPRPTYSAPSAPPAPTVASASSVNEVRESDKRRKGFQSTLLSKGQNPKRSRSRSKQQESKMRQGKPSYGQTTKKTLLGSAS